MNIWNITRLAFLEARQRKLLWAVVLLGLAFLAVFGTGVYFMWRDVSQMSRGLARALEPINFFLLAGLYGVDFLVVMLAVLTSVDAIAGEITSGTIQTIATKPLRRWEIVIGKWLGLAAMLTVFAAVMSAALMAIVWAITGYTPRNPLSGVALIVLEGLIMLTLSILGGTRLSTLTNGVVVFMVWGLAFIAGWIEQIGAVLRNEAAVNVGIVVSLLAPSEAMWKRAAYLMQPSFLRELGLDATPFGAATAPSEAMVVYALLYTAVALGVAVYWFQRRDL
ncbi:MAG: ABC transporter permease [Chloroflexi bacterium]|nr:ABC transporter permease [Chloroflexota bacterium]